MKITQTTARRACGLLALFGERAIGETRAQLVAIRPYRDAQLSAALAALELVDRRPELLPKLEQLAGETVAERAEALAATRAACAWLEHAAATRGGQS